MMWNWPLRGMKNKEEGKEVNMILDPFVSFKESPSLSEKDEQGKFLNEAEVFE